MSYETKALRTAEEIGRDLDAIQRDLDAAYIAKISRAGAAHYTPGPRNGTGTPGDQLIQSKSYQDAICGERSRFNITLESKATLSAAGEGLTGFTYRPDIERFPVERVTVASILGQARCDDSTVRFWREATFTNAATTVAEGALKPEATLDLTELSVPVRKVAVRARITDESFADFPALRDYVNGQLAYSVMAREELQILNGDGVAPNLLGITRTAGIQTEEFVAGGSIAESILNAIQKVRTVGFAEPDFVLMHPNDWKKLAVAKDANNQYFGGGYFFQQYGNGAYSNPGSIWGVPIIQTTSIGELPAVGAGGNVGLGPLVGAFRRGATIYRRNNLTIDATNSNADDFEKNLISIRAELRLALAVIQPATFCQVVNLAV